MLSSQLMTSKTVPELAIATGSKIPASKNKTLSVTSQIILTIRRSSQIPVQAFLCLHYHHCIFSFNFWKFKRWRDWLYLKVWKNRRQKPCNLFCTFAAKRVEKRCYTFYHPISNLSTTWFGARQAWYATRFAAKMQNKLNVFCCPFFRTLSNQSYFQPFAMQNCWVAKC